jgi:hypothetical protein
MSLSSCQCQRTHPPEISDAPKASELSAPKPPAMAESKPTPAAKAEPEPEEQTAVEPPPLPDDFPKDIPVLEGSTVAQVQNLANNARNVIFVTDKPVGNIATFYRKQLEDKGWKMTQNSVRESHAFVSFKRGNLIANLQVAQDSRYPGKRLVAIMYEDEKPLPFDDF